MHEGGGSCLKYLKRRWNRKEGRGNKDFKKGEGQAGSRVGCLKKGGGAGIPLQTMHNPTQQQVNLPILLICKTTQWPRHKNQLTLWKDKRIQFKYNNDSNWNTVTLVKRRGKRKAIYSNAWKIKFQDDTIKSVDFNRVGNLRWTNSYRNKI